MRHRMLANHNIAGHPCADSHLCIRAGTDKLSVVGPPFRSTASWQAPMGRPLPWRPPRTCPSSSSRCAPLSQLRTCPQTLQGSPSVSAVCPKPSHPSRTSGTLAPRRFAATSRSRCSPCAGSSTPRPPCATCRSSEWAPRYRGAPGAPAVLAHAAGLSPWNTLLRGLPVPYHQAHQLCLASRKRGCPRGRFGQRAHHHRRASSELETRPETAKCNLIGD